MISHHSPSSSSEPASRRRLLRLMGAGGAALLATLLPRNGVRAGHGADDGADVLHLGRANFHDASTLLDSDVADGPTLGLGHTAGGTALEAHSESGTAASFTSTHTALAVGGPAHVGGDHQGFLFGIHNERADEIAGGMLVNSRGGKPGVEADVFALDSDHLGVAIQGVSYTGTSYEDGEFAEGPGTGVEGLSGDGPGVQGHSKRGPGVQGHSGSGEGGHFSTDTGTALSTNGPVAMSGDRPQPLLGIENENTSEDAGAIFATSRGGGRTIEASIFQAVENPDLEPGFFGVAIQGVSNSGVPEDGGHGDGPGIGVAGFSGTGAGVLGNCAHGPGVVGQSDTSAGVMGGGTTDPGVLAGVLGGAPGDKPGVQALSAEFFGLGFGEPDGGLALEVIGKARFSTAGAGTVPQGANSVAVANSAVTADSHIMVTLTSAPGPRQLQWVERQPGTGFTVHLTSGPPSQRPATDFTYLIVEPVME